MELTQVLFFCFAALVLGLFPYIRNWMAFIASIFVIYWLQPAIPIRNLDFWLPTFTITITILTWIVTRNRNEPIRKTDVISASLILVIVLLVGLNRYLEPLCCLLPTRSPVWQQVFAGLVLITFLLRAFWYLNRWNHLATICIAVFLIGAFIILKNDTFSQIASIGLRTLTGQQPANASALDIRWIGFSYIAFRLLHILKDRTAGRLESVPLRDLVIFAIFFPTFSAGPIDRLQRFEADLKKPEKMSHEAFWIGGERILIGMFKKFILADSLALIALNDLNAAQTNHSGWLWVLVYIYTFRLYLDFSGYTDIAVGLGRWMGFHLPENFNRPYLQPNLTQFWNSWHITLAQWFRAYFFNPLTRWFRTQTHKYPAWLIILVGQLSTMVLIGLWHGINANFFIWGLWHGTGLFIHNRWTVIFQPWISRIPADSFRQRILRVTSNLVTFHYVTLGWVWFALTSPGSSWLVFQRLLGLI